MPSFELQTRDVRSWRHPRSLLLRQYLTSVYYTGYAGPLSSEVHLTAYSLCYYGQSGPTWGKFGVIRRYLLIGIELNPTTAVKRPLS